MSNSKCLYPGSFDPVTKGHMDIIERASTIFEHVYVAVLNNKSKQGFLSVKKRMVLLEKACEHLNNVHIISFEGLTIALAKKMDIQVLIRGVRGAADVENEMSMARTNRMLMPTLETLLLPATPERETISSTLVREIASFGGDISPFVPKSICTDILDAMKEK